MALGHGEALDVNKRIEVQPAYQNVDRSRIARKKAEGRRWRRGEDTAFCGIRVEDAVVTELDVIGGGGVERSLDGQLSRRSEENARGIHQE